MSVTALTLALMLGVSPQGAGQAEAVAATQAGPRAASPSRVIAARPAPQTRAFEGETRTQCRFEREMGSTLQRRVCREVPARGSVRNDDANEMLRRIQGSRLPDEG